MEAPARSVPRYIAVNEVSSPTQPGKLPPPSLVGKSAKEKGSLSDPSRSLIIVTISTRKSTYRTGKFSSLAHLDVVPTSLHLIILQSSSISTTTTTVVSKGSDMESDHKKQEQLRHHRRKPRLERRNAVKNIRYEASSAVSVLSSSSSPDHESSMMTDLRTRSMDLNLPLSYTSQTSFRINGEIDGEVNLICRSLGLSGPDDFAIPASAWEARKARSSSDILPRSRLLQTDDSATTMDNKNDDNHNINREINLYSSRFGERSVPHFEEEEEHHTLPTDSEPELVSRFQFPVNADGVGAGIRGARPPLLTPPPSMSLPILDKMSSTWDILKSLAPENVDVSSHLETGGHNSSDSENDEEAVEEEVVDSEDERETRLGVTAGDLTVSCSFSTSNDDDSSSTTTEAMYISPNGRFKRTIESWMRGRLLGSGSFGTVYEGISNDGFFFAVKEVSLLDQGSNAQQCINQLEQEIALLSQFEHENIVRYLGTDKEEAKLYIFIELVTQGSLASLYQKYHLRDSQVSAYTRQILHGLKYLHDRNVVHRDIKCANILVDASGSVKLADFGLAKETTKLSMLKSCKGSVYWMAPEVVNPRTTYGPAADIWSLGCTVLEMLTRQLPYPNLEWTSALFKIGRGEQPPIPSSLSREACDFIRQCVQVDPDDRPSASKLLDHPFVKRPLLPVSASSDSSSIHNNDRHSATFDN